MRRLETNKGDKMSKGYTKDEICEIVKRLKDKGIICHPDSAYCDQCDRDAKCQEIFTQFDKEREEE